MEESKKKKIVLGSHLFLFKQNRLALQVDNMSFTFGFSNVDLSEDEFEHNEKVVQAVASMHGQKNVLDSEFLYEEGIIQPQLESTEHLIGSLKGVRVSFEKFHSSLMNTALYRRELFDVKHQLMSEVDSPGNTGNVELEILIGETNEDLRKNVYEGGLKSWECSIDLVDLFVEKPFKDFQCQCVIELGCGTALPSEFLFMEYLRANTTKGLKFVLCDYNVDVLRLVTIPNLLIAWAKTVLSEKEWGQLQRSEDENIPVLQDEILITERLLKTFTADLAARNVEFFFISGSWGRPFINLLRDHKFLPSENTLILTSETIYQPQTLPIIGETILQIIIENQKRGFDVACLLAAKDIYFGVGGSIVEFEDFMKSRIEQEKLALSLSNFKINAGLKRSIIELK